VSCAEELHDLMNEMQAEIGASHAGVSYGEGGEEEDEGQHGFLGVVTTWDAPVRVEWGARVE
jgi:hypothetical protein